MKNIMLRVDARWVLFALYATILAFFSLNHAMWRDELEAWSIATSSSMPVELWSHVRYEGHPMLWYIPLWLASFISTDPLGIKIVNYVIMTAAAAIITFKWPVPVYEKAMIIFGYYFIYEYGVIDRNYGLCLLTVLVCAELMARPQVKSVWLYVVLGLMANTSIFGALLSLVLVGYINRRDWCRPWRVSPWVTVYILGLACAVLTLMAPEDRGISSGLFFGFDAFKVVKISFAFLVQPWDATLFLNLWFLTIVLSVFSIPYLFFKRKDLLLIYYGLFGACFCFEYFIHENAGQRHIGIMWMAFLMMYRLLDFRQSRHGIVFCLLMGMGLVSAGSSLVQEIQKPFSAARDVAAWIREEKLENARWMGYKDFAASTVAGYLQKPFYYPECQCENLFVVWTKQRERYEASNLAHDIVEKTFEKKDQPLYFLFSQKKIGEPYLKLEFPSSVHVEELKVFNNARIGDETYVVMKVMAVSP